MLDLLLVASLGFLGSFGHCVGMCSPIALAFALSQQQSSKMQQLGFHLLLNLGRIASYALVGVAIGGLGSVLISGGQFAGLGSALRQGIAIVMGVVLVWLGLTQIKPGLLPSVPILHPLTAGKGRDRLGRKMVALSLHPHWWTPALLGLGWGLIPCGFLYTAQIKAAESGNLWRGGLTMLAFGLGTLPTMLGVGVGSGMISAEKRHQLLRLGGWITLLIGLLTLTRTGDMTDYTGYVSLICLMLALVARPLARSIPVLLAGRRVLGVSAFVLALAHMGHMLTMGWNLQATPYLLPALQLGTWAGVISVGLLTPLALTSIDRLQRVWGDRWRQLHLLSIPAFLLAVLHTVLLGSHFLGAMEWSWSNWLAAVGLIAIAIVVLLLRQPWFWSLLSRGANNVASIRGK